MWTVGLWHRLKRGESETEGQIRNSKYTFFSYNICLTISTPMVTYRYNILKPWTVIF